MNTAPRVTLTILYDNNPAIPGAAPTDPHLRTGWGFSCLVQRGETKVLFDTGGDADTLANNLRAVDVDPRDIGLLVLSHEHSDHTGGIEAILTGVTHPRVFVPASFSASFKSRLAERADVVEVTGPATIADGIRTTGEMGSAIVEQSLVVETADGLVVITGCAHPGIVRIVRTAATLGDVALVIGGFHLGAEDAAACRKIASRLDTLGVDRVAPTHCSGETAKQSFAAVFGDRYLPAGVGTVITIGQ